MPYQESESRNEAKAERQDDGVKAEAEPVAQLKRASSDLGGDTELLLENLAEPSRQKSALSGSNSRSGGPSRRWRPSIVADGVWELRDGKNAVQDFGDRITASNGNAQEVQKMLEMGVTKRWNPMAFSGSADFKREVMKAALENGLTVQAFSNEDRALLGQVELEHKKSNAQSNEKRELNQAHEKSGMHQPGAEIERTDPSAKSEALQSVKKSEIHENSEFNAANQDVKPQISQPSLDKRGKEISAKLAVKV